MLKYRIILRVGYCESWFEFDTPIAACDFAKTALLHQVTNEDTEKRPTYVTMKVVDTELEAQRKKEEDEDEDE